MNSALEMFAYAKINLGLAVTGKRDDGYHNIETVFQSIDLGDVVRLRAIPEGIVCKCGEWSGTANLAYRAAELFLQNLKTKFSALSPGTGNNGVEIEIEKFIPAEAGLAGGSSDAAATLTLMNRLHGSPYSAAELDQMGARLGADVAFCLHGGTIWAWGRGEKLARLPDAPKLDLIIVKPDEGVPTPAAYGRLAQMKAYGRLRRADWEEALQSGNRDRLAGLLYNDLERPSFQLVPKIAGIKKELLRLGCKGALMCGSGSAVFGIGEDEDHVQAMAAVLQRRGYTRIWVAHTIGKSR